MIGKHPDPDFDRRPPIWLVGASVRAVAWSVHRAGWPVWACDRFGDLDLMRMVQRYLPWEARGDLRRHARLLPPCSVVYTGGVENHRGLVRWLQRRHRLLGNGCDALRVVRSPWRWARIVAESGMPVPAVCRTLPMEANPADWIEKPLRSGGGLGVRVAESRHRRGGCFFQRRVEGPSWGAVFLARRGQAHWIGLTRQWRADGGAGVGPFHYAGSVGPIAVAPAARLSLQRVADALVQAGGLRGWFGIDLVGQPGQWQIVEINPRYVASVEVLERAAGKSLFPHHLWACLDCPEPLDRLEPPHRSCNAARNRIVGKVVCYAAAATTGSQVVRAARWIAGEFGVELADVPRAEATFTAGGPMITLLQVGTSPTAVEATLQEASAALRGAIRQAARCD